ncbi:MAG: ABC transporter ATP-binding protein [Methanobrevibacter millerae]|uniref:ABC transporter ATP-binding protein n=1 Tax=Methanobrevibacter millerae TaxID=230361 RepID=A0A8T3VBT4_9EURY|nr:ABC transporter ATP-binding protein [Methanobrevibacter millerae]MBE6504622.1 ABC transporter ATP-binding protein [Methanobrevibacter millerae]
MRNLVRVFKNKLPQVLIIFLLLIVQAYCDLALPSYTANIVDIGIQNADINYIMDVGFLMLIMVAISVFATIGVSFFSSRVSSGYAKDLRKVVYAKVLKFSNHELNKISRSSLITRSTNDINQLQNVLVMMLMMLFFAPILGIGSIIKAFEIGGGLSWIILVTFLVVLSLLAIITIRVLPYFKLTQEIIDKMNKTAREILIGIPVIKAFVRQDYEKDKFGKINNEFLDVNLYVFRKIFILMPTMTLFLNLMIVLILYFGAYDAIAGNILTGDIIAFTQYSTQVVSSFIMLGGVMIILPRFLVSARRVAEVLNMELSITDGELTSINDNPTIEFKNVSYSYPGSEKETLKDINFKLVPGKTTAIIGGTGSGKSTILNLIPRLQDVTSGEILIDNENIKNFKLKTLRDKISFTPQDAILFQGTVKSNMKSGKSDADDEEIKNALNLAQVDFVDDIDDEVSQGGSNFSGGQKQRLSIARAIIGPHDFYLFDDCFSALDMNTEAVIKSNLDKIAENSSVLFVSQRISTIKDADEIIVLDNGKIIDKGSHDDLINRCEVYSEIASSQMEESLCLQ